jgi:hypothetical protein
VNDLEDTRPHRMPVRPKQCSTCLRSLTSHSEFCLQVADEERVRRAFLARVHFFRMKKLDRVLALAVGAAKRGATLHYHGEIL